MFQQCWLIRQPSYLVYRLEPKGLEVYQKSSFAVELVDYYREEQPSTHRVLSLILSTPRYDKIARRSICRFPADQLKKQEYHQVLHTHESARLFESMHRYSLFLAEAYKKSQQERFFQGL